MGFQNDFFWGAASASAQIEGAWDEDGRTPSIWDNMPDGKVKRNETCHTACDHYHHWQEDVEIMGQIGLNAYRFSISWSRVVPRRGEVNPQGILFYKNLVHALKERGIEPMVTLYHWDLPVWAFEAGGWESSDVVDAYLEYVEVVLEALSDEVGYWFTFNEPQCFATDYVERKEEADIKAVTRNIMLAHGKAVRLIREKAVKQPKIGLAVMGMSMEPVEGQIDIRTAAAMTYSDMIGVMGMGWWMDPIILGQIPDSLKDTITKEDIEVICQPLDLYAGNVYFSVNYADMPSRQNPLALPGMPRSLTEWPVCDDCLYHFVKAAWERYHLPVMITENGFANVDFVMLDGKVHDPQRTDYIHRCLRGLKRIVEEGVPVLGYMYWSILDNFEWHEGYDKRFGLVHVDYQTQKRTIKDSAYFYAEIIRTNGENL
ncbi:MAG: family 1 glycosylhydrolase [Faecalicatena sp.]|uniref:glycoside hydrolase family 1 protein n=1 Tax=Faecalicatena sp. TaxID=2005360 RepID=UPI00258D7464|nr:family 1 glycosylhydrolase [Faecalicatena sp.]MCI6465665.1 family 1 glycosylhydrolase [Faecalicatena sp.]MDY5618060.1 family 1 glycosylhydrolase [Lachnospiraceae bacterium]